MAEIFIRVVDDVTELKKTDRRGRHGRMSRPLKFFSFLRFISVRSMGSRRRWSPLLPIYRRLKEPGASLC